MALKFTACELARPFIKCLPHGKVRALAFFGARDQNDTSWEGLPNPHRVFYDPSIHAYVTADLREWGGRWHYFAGTYYDQENRLVTQRLLSPGDTYVDVGANFGMHSLAVARIVGDKGRVIAIEPNPAVFAKLQAHVVFNGLSNITLFNVGLADQPGELTLAGAGNHPGTCTFRPLPDAVYAVKVPVVRGDDLLQNLPPTGRVLVKVDTEGFEHHVIRGMRNLLKRPNIAFSVEVTDAWLRQTGSCAQDLFDDFRANNFDAYEINRARSWLRPAIRLTPLTQPSNGQHDVLFVRPGML